MDHHTFNTRSPVCPACHHEMTTDEMVNHIHRGDDLFAIAPNEGRAELDCPACGQHYHIKGSYCPQYCTSLSEDDL